jgi:predicted transcriptional regulator
MSQTITITLSESLYKQLQRAAELSHQPTETIIAQSLAHTLPSLLEDIPVEYQPDVYPLLPMSNPES